MTESEAIEVVKATLRDMSEELGYPALANPLPETELFGGTDGIDSLSLVRIVADVERTAQERCGKPVVLADERAMSRRNSPYRTVLSLAQLLAERTAEPAR